MSLPYVPEEQPRAFASLAEIDTDKSLFPNTPENEQANADLFADNPILANNFINSVKQVNRELSTSKAVQEQAQTQAALGPGAPVTGPNAGPAFRAQSEARALASLGRVEGFWSSEKEIATAYRRQLFRTKHAERKYGVILEEAQKKYGDKLLELDPEELADVIESSDGFEDESAKRDFISNATPFHERLGVSPYHAVRSRLSSKLPDFMLGQKAYMSAKSSSSKAPFRFTLDEKGRHEFRAYRAFYDKQINEAVGSSATDVFYSIADIFSNAFIGVGQSISPDTILSPEWRSDPQKYKRAMDVISRASQLSKRMRTSAVTIGAKSQKAIMMAEDAGRFESLPDSDVIITDPDAPVSQAFADEMSVIKEVQELEREGAFDKRSRASAAIGLVDAFMYSTTGLAGMGLYSVDPGSVVNMSQSVLDGLSKNDRETAMIQRVNEAIAFNEMMSEWRDSGFVFPMGNQWYASNPYMVRGFGEIIDPFMAVGAVKWIRHLKRAGMTKAAVEAEVLRNTDRLRKLSEKTLELPPEIRLQVENVRKTITGPNGIPEYAGKELTDWDVLDIIARGKGMVSQVDQSGNILTRSINVGEFESLANLLDDFTTAQAASRARRQRGLDRLANKNSDKVFSQFGKYLADNFPVELRGIKDLDLFKSVVNFFKNVRGFAQAAKPIGRQVIEEAPNKGIAFGMSKLVKGAAMASGINFVMSGGETANPLGGPGAYIATIYAMNDILQVMEFTGDKGKFMGEFIQAASTGRQINGSVAAYKVHEKTAQIRRLQLELSKELTEAEKVKIFQQIDNLKSEIGTWHTFSAYGGEKALLFLGKNSYNTLTAGAILDVMMESNDRSSTGAFALAGTMTMINAGFGSLYRNVNSGRIRKDQQRSVFAYNLLNMEPEQAQRALAGYKLWKDKGFGDDFITYINMTFQNRGSNQQVQLVTPSEMHVASTLISAGDILANADSDPYQLRLNYIEEFRRMNPGASVQDAEAFANSKIDELVSKNAINARALADEKALRALEHRTQVSAGTLDAQTLELQAANEVLAADMQAIGIPGLGSSGVATSFTAADLLNVNTFRQALARNGVNWDPTSLFQDPDINKKFTAFKASLVEYIKLKRSYDMGAIEFGRLSSELEAAKRKAAASADEAVNSGENKWRPGQSFLHTDYATGVVGQGTVIGNGVYIVDHLRRENPDYDPNDPNSEQMVHSSVLLLDYTKFDPKTFYEEWGHRLFMAESFRDARVLLYRDAIGEWGPDENGNRVLLKKGWAWETITNDEGKEVHSFPSLRMFAMSYASRLPEDVAKNWMAQFDLAVERFNENPSVNYAMLMPVFNELFANAYSQRMLQVDTSSQKIWSDPTTRQAGGEGSPMLPVGTNVTLGKVIYGKMMAGELTVSETASILKAMRSGQTSDLTPESRNFVLKEISALIRAAKEGSSVARLEARRIFRTEQWDKIEKAIEDGKMNEVDGFIAQAVNSVTGAIDTFGTYTKDVPMEMFYKVATFFGKGGELDSLIVKGAQERLLGMGLSPEIFGDGGWTSGAIFDENGNPSVMPGNLMTLVDMVRYGTRTRVGVPDKYLMGDINFWNDDGTFSPEKAKGYDIVLWAAANNKTHWLEPGSSSRFKPMGTIVKENNERAAAFINMLRTEQAAGRAKGINIVKGQDGYSITGRFTKQDVARFKKVMQGSNFIASEKRMLLDVVEALSEYNPQQVPAFVINYKSMQYATVNSPKILRRAGGYDATRGMIPISIFIKQTGETWDGKKLPKDQKLDMVYIRGADIDALARRTTLAWNGTLLDEKDVPVVERDAIRSIFNGNAKLVRQSVLDYLEMIATGGTIGATRSSTVYPLKTTVQMFTDRILLEPERYGLSDKTASPQAVAKIAAEMARVVHGIVGAPNIDALFKKEKKMREQADDAEEAGELGELAEFTLNDNERGRMRIFEKERSIQKPSWGMRDKNFIITDFRLDRIIHMRQTDRRFPWSPNSYFWNQVAYGAKSPNAWASVRKGDRPITGVGLHIADIVAASAEEGAKLRDLGVTDVFDHVGSGYKMVLTGAGTYRIYDVAGKFVGEEKTIGRAKDLAVQNAWNDPTSRRHRFDQTMASLGFIPQGIQYVAPKGSFIRRTRYISQDGRLLIKFDGENASVYDTSSKTAGISGPRLIAKGIKVDPDGKGGYDLSEMDAAIQFSQDEMTHATPLTYEVVDELTGRATQVTAMAGRGLRPVFENVDPAMLEFMPHMIGSVVRGQRVYARNNPAYYSFKRSLIDYIGSYKAANKVIAQMKAELGDAVVETDGVAVQNWVEKYIADKQAELDRIAQEARDKQRAREDAKIQSNLIDPIAQVFAGANAERQQAGLPEFTLSVEEARNTLLANVGKFAALQVRQTQTPLPDAAQSPNFQTAEGEARNRFLKSLNAAAEEATEARRSINTVINQMWVNASGYTLSLELLPSAPLLGGIAIETRSLGETLRLPFEGKRYWGTSDVGRPKHGPGSLRTQYGYGNKKEPNTTKYRWVIYNPAGGFLGQYETKEEAYRAMLKADEESKRRALQAKERARNVSR